MTCTESLAALYRKGCQPMEIKQTIVQSIHLLFLPFTYFNASVLDDFTYNLHVDRQPEL
jgi:hypothetical protein